MKIFKGFKILLNKVDQSIFKVITVTTENDTGSELERIHAVLIRESSW